MLKQKYFLADIFILSAEKQPIKLSWRKIVCLHILKSKGNQLDEAGKYESDNTQYINRLHNIIFQSILNSF